MTYTLKARQKYASTISDSQKLAQIRSRNGAFASTIAPNTGAIKLMSLCGWHAITENLEKTWVFDYDADSSQMRYKAPLYPGRNDTRQFTEDPCEIDDDADVSCHCRALQDVVTELNKALEEVNRKDKVSQCCSICMPLRQPDIGLSLFEAGHQSCGLPPSCPKIKVVLSLRDQLGQSTASALARIWCFQIVTSS